MRMIKKHASPGVVLGVIAIVLALAGTSIALVSNTVGGKALRSIVTKTAGGTVAAGSYGEFTANCNAKQQIISGGVDVNNAAINEFTPILESRRQGNGWYARVQNGFATPKDFTVQAYCLKK